MTRYPVLDYFFGGYMHQDWREDYPDEWAALDDFIRSEPEGSAAGFCKEASQLLATEPTEAELRELLLEDFGAAAMVENKGWKYRDWIQAMSDHAAKATGHSQAS